VSDHDRRTATEIVSETERETVGQKE